MKLFVWDLHGVLEQGNDQAVIDISNQVLADFGYEPRFQYDDGKRLYGLKWYEYFAFLLADEPHERHLELQDACFVRSEEREDLQRQWLRPTPNVVEVLEAITAHQHEQILISNTKQATLEVFLKLLGIADFFLPDHAFAVDQHVRHATLTKQDILARFLSESRGFEELIIIGDSPSDMKLSDVAGGITYLFAHPEFPFRDCRADFQIRDLRDVLERL